MEQNIVWTAFEHMKKAQNSARAAAASVEAAVMDVDAATTRFTRLYCCSCLYIFRFACIAARACEDAEKHYVATRKHAAGRKAAAAAAACAQAAEASALAADIAKQLETTATSLISTFHSLCSYGAHAIIARGYEQSDAAVKDAFTAIKSTMAASSSREKVMSILGCDEMEREYNTNYSFEFGDIASRASERADYWALAVTDYAYMNPTSLRSVAAAAAVAHQFAKAASLAAYAAAELETSSVSWAATFLKLKAL